MPNLKKALVFSTFLSMSLGASLILGGCDNSGAQPSANVQPVAQQSKAPPPAAKPAPAQPQKADPKVDSATQTPPAPQPMPAPMPQQPQVPQPVDPAAFIVKVDPTEVDFGEIPTGDVGVKVVKLINTGDKPMTVVTHRVTCGCTALDLTPNTVLAPKEVKDVKVQLNGGVTPGELHGKKVTFVVEGQPELELPLKATAVSFVTQEPAKISPEANPDGKLVLKSRDGTKFKILSMQPPLVTEFSSEPKAEHEVTIDWAKYREIGVTRKTMFYFDHPKCQSLMANVEFSPEEIAKAMAAIQKQQPINPNPEPLPPPPPLDPMTQLQQQIQQGQNGEVLKKIADGSLDPNARDAQGLSLLSMSAKSGNVDLMKALINAKADVETTDNSGRTPLMHAATSKNVEAVRVLLDHGASLTAKDIIGGTALSWASGFGDAGSVKELLDAGADVEIIGRITGWTPLIWASGFGDPGSIPLLTKLGANVEAADYIEGATPLIHAARTGRTESISALIKAGAKLETPDLNGKTPLLAAAANSGGDVVKVKALLDAGANIHAKDNRGLNALQLARKRTDPRQPDVLKVLEPLLAAETPADAATPAAAVNTSGTPAAPATPAKPPAGAAGNAVTPGSPNGGKTGN